MIRAIAGYGLVLGVVLSGSGCLFEAEPVYAEFRIRDMRSDVELLGFARMESMDDCQERRQRVLDNMTRNCPECRVSYQDKCLATMPDRYAKLFDNQRIQATYLVLERGKDKDERDARLVIFGVPSSAAIKVCPAIQQSFKRSYSGAISCVQGTVG